MTIDQLNYLLVLAEERSFPRAAKRLYVTQPTLTAFVSKLEKELGTKLFDRSHTPVRLTPNGEFYIKKMRELVLEENRLKYELKYHNSCRQRIRIGLGYAHSLMWACDLSERLLEADPQLDIIFSEGQEADLLCALKEGELDLFFGHTNMDPVNVHYGVLFQEKIVLLVPSTFFPDPPEKTSMKQPYLIAPETLYGKRLIMPGNSMGLHLNTQLLTKKYHIDSPSIIQTSNILTGAQMVSHGFGYMLGNDELLRFLSPKYRRQIVHCILPEMSSDRKYYYGYLESNQNLELIEKSIQIMRSLVK